MVARVVIGANFGDEGKGLLTDYLCATQGAGAVVRFNGGAQAGHTVVTPDGLRHIFSHFGSGTFCGVPTFLSQYFICNPITFLDEYKQLSSLGLKPSVFAHPSCLVTTFADMMINQRLEDERDDNRHGSCGLGVNETINRSIIGRLRITVGDLWNRAPLEDILRENCTKYAQFRTKHQLKDFDEMIDQFIKHCHKFADLVHPAGISQCKDPIFEGAQGLLLDQSNKEYYPHLTRSNTGMKNVRVLCEQAGIEDIDIYYVSRTYLTRHGAGPLPGEDPKMSFEDDTNLEHPYQGKLRFALLDVPSLMKRCEQDAGDRDFKLVFTHCDQLPAPKLGSLYFKGPTRNDVVV